MMSCLILSILLSQLADQRPEMATDEGKRLMALVMASSSVTDTTNVDIQAWLGALESACAFALATADTSS